MDCMDKVETRQLTRPPPEPSPVRPTITSTTRVYITVRPTATGTGVPVAPKNGTSVTLPPIQSATGAGASNSVPVMVLGGAAAIAYALI